MPPTDGATPTSPSLTSAPFFRAYSPRLRDHLYTTDPLELNLAADTLGYVKEGNLGLIFTSPDATTVPLYRLLKASKTDHYYTSSLAELQDIVRSGYNIEGIAGYVYAAQISGSVPLYRLYNPVRDDHFLTANEAEKIDNLAAEGYVDKGRVGFILPPP